MKGKMALRFIYLGVCVIVFLSLTVSKIDGLESDDIDEDDRELSDPASTNPKFISNPGEHSILQGSTATLPCKVSDLGDSTVTWVKILPLNDENTQPTDTDQNFQNLFVDGVALTVDSRLSMEKGDRSPNGNDYSLTISDVTAYDSGPYECRISTDPESAQRQILKVKVPPHVSIEPEREMYTVEPGHTLSLTCTATGFPEPEVTWKRVANNLPDGKSSESGKNKAMIFYDNVTIGHKGTYRCTASNEVGERSKEIVVQVYSKDNRTNEPTVHTDRDFVPVRKGETVTLACNYSGFPIPGIKWFYNYLTHINTQDPKWLNRVNITTPETDPKPIHGHNLELPYRTTLTIKNIEESDFGEYVCKASNSLASNERVIMVTGKPGPPYGFTGIPREDRIDFSWRLESASEIEQYKLYYRKADEDLLRLWIDVNGSHGRRIQGNEWQANYSFVWTDKIDKFKPGDDAKFSIQGVNEYGDGSLPKQSLEIRIPGKYDLSGEQKAKLPIAASEASKSTKMNGHNGATKFYQKWQWTISSLPLTIILRNYL